MDEVTLDPAEGGKPVGDGIDRGALDRLEQKRHVAGGQIAGNRGGAAGLEIGGARQVEAIEPRQRLFHATRIGDLVCQRFGVLHGQGGIDRLKPGIHPQKGGKPVQHTDVGDIVVIDVKGRLAGGLQRAQQADLKGLHLIKVGFEFQRVEAGLGLFQVLGIGQLPLAGGLGDLEADVAFHGVAGQHDLGAARIGDQQIKDAGVVIVEIAKASQTGRAFAHAAQKQGGVNLALWQGDAEHFGLVFLADEDGVEHFAVAGDAGQGVQICLEEIGTGSHFSEHDETVETRRHGITLPNRGGRGGFRPDAGHRPPENRPSAQVASPDFAGFAGIVQSR